MPEEARYYLVLFRDPQKRRSPTVPLVEKNHSNDDTEKIANHLITPVYLDDTSRELIRDLDQFSGLASILPTPRARELPLGQITTFEDLQPNENLPFVAADLTTDNPALIIYRRNEDPRNPQTRRIRVPLQQAGYYLLGERAISDRPDKAQEFEFSLACVRRRGGQPLHEKVDPQVLLGV